MPAPRATILLIEDDPLQAQVIKGMATDDGGLFCVKVAGNFEKSLECLGKGGIDLILLDLALSDRQRLEPIAALAEIHRKFTHLPIIVLTATDNQETVQEAIKAGARDHLVKGRMDPQLLQRSIRYAIERSQTETALLEKEQSIRRLADALPEAIALYDLKEGRLIYANEQAHRMFGASLAEFDLFNLQSVTSVDAIEGFNISFEYLLKSPNGTASEREVRVKNNEGEWRWLNCRHIVYRRDLDGRPREILFLARDITRRKLAEEALRESEDRYRDLVENSGLFIGTHDTEGRIQTVNQSVLTFLGLKDADELSGRSIYDFLPENSRPLFQIYLDTVLTEGKASGLVRFKSPGGQSIIIEYANSLRGDVEGPAVVRCIGRDVTKRARAEAALLESEERLRLALTSAGMGAWEWNLAGDKIIGDEYVRGLLDGTGGVASALEKVHPDDRELVRRQIQKGAESDEVQNLQFRVISGKGEERWVEGSARLRRDESGSLERAIGVVHDITTRKRTQERLREQADLLDDSTDAIALLDLEDRITFWNRAAERLYGWKFDEVKGKRLDDLLLAETPPSFGEAKQKLFEEGKWRGEVTQITKDGSEIIIESRRTLILDEQGNPKSVFVINTDITEKKQFEAVVLRAQRMESIGSLASAIAHDLNNVLAPIMMALHTLQQRFTDDNSQRWLSLMHKSAERGKDLVERVLAFARGAEGERAPLQTANLIRDITRILKETLPKNIELQVQAPEDLWDVIGDTTQIHQVLMNLCLNARDAMPGGGKLMIKVRNRYLVEEEKRLVTNPEQKQYVRITVADNGVGIPREIIDRVFDPFFTTKGKGQGTGLGLSTVLAIVRGHGGFVNLFSKVGKGSEFKVYLPAQESVAVESEEAVKADLPSGHGELILIVDDEADIREVTASTLAKYGYRVLSARDGQEAVEIYRQRGSEINLVVTDMVMPNLDGSSTIRALKVIDPNTLVIATSGVRAKENIGDMKMLGVRAFLPKPYTAERLLETVAESLNRNLTDR